MVGGVGVTLEPVRLGTWAYFGEKGVEWNRT